MNDECFYCKFSEMCPHHGDEDTCSEILERAIEDARKEYYEAWFDYISDYVDY